MRCRPVVKNVAEMTIAMRGAYFRARHAVPSVAYFDDVGRLDRLGEARPAAAGIKLVSRGEQWFARDNVDVDPGRPSVQVKAGSGVLGGSLLSYAILHRGQLRDRCQRFLVHRCRAALPKRAIGRRHKYSVVDAPPELRQARQLPQRCAPEPSRLSRQVAAAVPVDYRTCTSGRRGKRTGQR